MPGPGGRPKPSGVFVHGYSCGRDHWADTIAALEPDIDGLAVSLPGHDDAPLPEGEFDVAACAEGIVTAVESAGRAESILIGHSLGGMAGMIAVHDRPDLFAGLVLVDAFLRMGPPSPFGQSFWSGSPPGIKAPVVRRMISARRSLPATLWKSIVHFDGMRYLAGLRRPVRAIYGDRGVPDHARLQAEVLATGLDQAGDIEVYMVSRAGHFVMLEQPDLFRDILRDVVVSFSGR